MKIVLPYHYEPRPYQLPFWRAMVGPGNPNGKRRAYLLRHRRAGKDKDAFNYMVQQAFQRVGVYYYFFPSYAQGRKALWDNVDRDGFKFLDHIPKDLISGTPNQTEMKVLLKNGSLIQVVGSDNIDTVVGSNPVGVVFSEYSLQDPSGYNFVRPILRENGGWAVFTLTPRGANHAKDLYDMAVKNDEWYVEKLTVDDTWGKGGTVSPAQVEEERASGMSESLIQQEFYCFPKGTRIWTDKGQVPIEQLRIGDVVLSHAGRWRKITNTMARENDEAMVEIVSAGSCEPLICTKSHPVRVCDPSSQTYRWVPAGDVKLGQYVVMPRLKAQNSAMVVDGDLALLIAWFIAEGSVAKTAVQFSISQDEKEEAEKITEAAKRYGNVLEVKDKGTKSKNVIVKSAWLADFLTTNCGSGALNKRIPWHLIAGHERLVYESLLDGDGCRGNYSGNVAVYTTISYSLALDFQMLAHMLGYRASVVKQKRGQMTMPHGGVSNCNDSYSVRISNRRKTKNGVPFILPQKHGVAAKVTRKIELPPCETVHNISVQFDESYVAEGRVVHNCDFNAAIEHAVFGEQLLLARKEGRITNVPWQRGLLVNTYWDIGRDTTAIWFEQTLRNEVRLIDYHSATHSTLDREIALLQAKPYNYGVHYLPHDADYRDYKTGTTPKEVAAELGLPVEVLPKTYEQAHIDAARMLFNRCWFDEKNCEAGIAALQNWHYAYDEKTRSLGRSPLHDWSSHGSKAFAYVAVGHQDELEWKKPDRYAGKQKKHRSWMTA